MQQKIREAIRQAKEKWMEEQCAEIEELILKHDNFTLHKKLKEAGNISDQPQQLPCMRTTTDQS